MVIGEMTVLGFAGYSTPPKGRQRLLWLVRCSCGKEKPMLSTTLKNTKVRSCGHLRGGNVLPDHRAAITLRMSQYKSNAIKMGRVFSLTREQFQKLITGNCVYCGSRPSSIVRARGKYQKDFYYNGIDRIDNDVGYTLENSASCCSTCNLMKRGWSVDAFLEHIRKIASYRTEGYSGDQN